MYAKSKSKSNQVEAKKGRVSHKYKTQNEELKEMSVNDIDIL